MEYPHILNLIDDYLDRLTEARELLLSCDSPPISAEKKRTVIATVSKTPRRSAAREKQAVLALTMFPATAETSTTAKTGATEKRSNRRIKKAQEAVVAPVSIQDELFLQPPPSEPLHAEEIEEREQETPQEPVAPSVVKVRAQRRPSGRSKAPTVAAERALGGLVSAAPVFIRAEQIRQELAQKVTPSGTEGAIPAEVPLTAEMLTQRWLQGLSS